MELEFQREQVTYLQSILHETVMQEENAEAIVPDSMPDMERIVDSCAGLVMRGKECQGGNVSLTGDIQASVLYLAQQEDTPRVLPMYLPFSLHRTVAGEDCSCSASCRIVSVEARMLNSRKVGIRVGVCIHLEVWEKQEELCCKPGAQPRYVQMKCCEYPMLLTVECAEKNLLLRDTVSLPQGMPEAEAVIFTTGRCEITDEKLNGSKAVCKGNLMLQLLYGTPEGKIRYAELPLPFSHVMELSDSYEEQGLRLQPMLTALEAVAEGTQFTVEAGICMQCTVAQTRCVCMVEDAYATRGRLELAWQEYGMRPRLDSRLLRQELREEFNVSASQVIRAEALPECAHAAYQDGMCKISVGVRIRVLYQDKEGAYQSVCRRAELCVQLPSANRQCTAAAWPEGAVFAAPGPGGIEVRLPMVIQCDWYSDAELRSISGGTWAQEKGQEELPAVIIRTMEEDCPLWDIAKELHTTVSAIQLANDMEEDSAQAGTMLLIPIVA